MSWILAHADRLSWGIDGFFKPGEYFTLKTKFKNAAILQFARFDFTYCLLTWSFAPSKRQVHYRNISQRNRLEILDHAFNISFQLDFLILCSIDFIFNNDDFATWPINKKNIYPPPFAIYLPALRWQLLIKSKRLEKQFEISLPAMMYFRMDQ